MSILRFTLFSLFLSVAGFAHAQDVPDYGGVPDKLIQKVGEKDFKGMFKVMFSAAKNEQKSDTEMLDGFSKQLEEQLEDAGDFLDADLYKEERFGQRVSILNYVVNYSSKPVGVTIKMYKTRVGWVALNVMVKSDFDKFLNEMRGLPASK